MLNELSHAARTVFNSALASVDTRDAIRRAVNLDGARLTICDTEIDLSKYPSGIFVIAIGKAALAMASTTDEILRERITSALVVGNFESGLRIEEYFPSLRQPDTRTRWSFFRGGHPLPNEASLQAGRAAFEILSRANNQQALVLFLISGGGSAMIEMLRDESITLEDIRAANRALVSCGATIAEINSVRRAFSALKGGGLAARAPDADQITLIVSDTNEGDEANVSSGPTMSPSSDEIDPLGVIARYDLAKKLPESILRIVEGYAPTEYRDSSAMRKHYVALDNHSAISRAAETARALGFTVEVAPDIVEQPIEVGCTMLVSRLTEIRKSMIRASRGVCLISGGEFSCRVRGDGIGGRNSETALRLALALENEIDVVALSAGTDGVDGNSPADGAIADSNTVRRASAIGIDAKDFLVRSDSYSFFHALGDEIATGPTGTNVRDLRIIMAR